MVDMPELVGKILVVVFIIGVVCMAIYGVYDITAPGIFCKDKGYSERTPLQIEDGYVECCNPIYVNHKRQEQDNCSVFKYRW